MTNKKQQPKQTTMSNDTISPPSVNASVTSRVPRERYTGRFYAGADTKSAKGNRMIHASCEILQPDTITVEGQECVVAGRKFDAYFIIDPSAERSLSDAFAAFAVLQLLDSNGEINPAKIVEAMNSGGVCFDVVLDSEENVQRYLKKPGQTVGDPILGANGKPLSSGWRIKFPGANDWAGRVPTLAGLPEPQPF